ncbi:MAG: c-type cytochrome [Elusimicrobia bacterium]|nr:c-type cytochrome [Elusimicrobiota bacterium]
MNAIKFILILFVFISGCARTTAQFSEGKAHFVGYGCNTCHRVAEVGGILGPDLTTIGFRKKEEWLDLWLKNPPEWKKNTLMPNFYLKDHVRKALVEYLSSLKGEDFRKGTAPWDHPELMQNPIKRGEVIFNRVGCVGCHAKEGKGGYPNNNVSGGEIPSLTFVADGFSKEELKDRLKKGSKPLSQDPHAPDPMIEMPAWGAYLKEDELDALVEYLYSLRPALSAEEAW